MLLCATEIGGHLGSVSITCIHKYHCFLAFLSENKTTAYFPARKNPPPKFCVVSKHKYVKNTFIILKIVRCLWQKHCAVLALQQLW